MSIVHRRIFQARVGQSGPLVQHFQEAHEQMKGYGIAWETRIYTDYLSGRSDRVAVEWVFDDIGEMDAEFGRIMGIPEAAAYFEAWMAKMNDMIHYADAENWTVV